MKKKKFMKFADDDFKARVKLEKLLCKLNIKDWDRALIHSICAKKCNQGIDFGACVVEDIYKKKIERIPNTDEEVNKLAVELTKNIGEESYKKGVDSYVYAVCKTIFWVNNMLNNLKSDNEN